MAETVSNPIPATSPLDSLSPAMKQYVEQKQRVGDAILLFRMGDFYETFYDDAVLCSKVLGIALTSRSKDQPIPLAGIPYHALNSYLRKLVAAGYKVAISEQLEDARFAKGVIKRDIVRIVTAGTLTDETLLDEREQNILAAICIQGNAIGTAWVELASGRFEVLDAPADQLLDELTRLRPAEVLSDDERDSKGAKLSDQLRAFCDANVTRRPLYEFSAYQAEQTLHAHFQVATLAGFGFERITPALCAAGEIVQYLNETQKSALGHLTALRRRVRGDTLLLDHCTFRALEIERSLRGNSREGTLLSAVDRTVHPIGARKLREWFCAPLIDRARIEARHDAVTLLIDEDATRRHIRESVKKMSDVERIAARVALNRATPRDLAGLSRTLQLLPGVVQLLGGIDRGLLLQFTRDLSGLDDLRELLSRALRPDPPPTSREGGVIADGFNAELDRLRAIGHDGQTWLADYQRREIQRTGLPNLRVGFNRVFGYYIEISRSGQEKVPPDYVRRQTVKNAERYITDELKQYETEVLTARERADELENRLFDELVARVRTEILTLQRVADAIGQLDCLAALAELALERRYVRPMFVDDGRLEIVDGRHPVLEQTLADRLVPNDSILSPREARVFIITGPNMAGKSTYIRQVALLTLMAHAGSFVPAKSMTCSVVDRVFARVGSADEIIRGQSTFMVEMTEAANILHNATDRSLVILDEIGRGTSTFDGLALAWAITEHLANVTRCKTLIATHYHEMIELAELVPGIRNYNVAVREVPTPDGKESHIIFLHRIIEGGADRSYGLHVAKLAGVPNSVIQRSRAVLAELQKNLTREVKSPALAASRADKPAQLPLFTDPAEELLRELLEINVNELTPIAALQRLMDWKSKLASP